jgi:mRNA interferase RelE/StbE
MRKTTYLKNAHKTLSDYDKSTRKRLIEAVDKIPQGDIKKLQGEKYPPLYRLRVGKYRIIYHVEQDEIIIVKIDTRGDVYK